MKKVLILGLFVAIIGLLFIALRPQSQSEQKNASPQAARDTEAEVRTFSLEVKNGRLVSGDEILKLNQGEEVRIVITSDTTDELHLHGYDKEVLLTAGQSSELIFTTSLTGRFEAEMHNTEETLFVVEVRPK